MSTEPNQVKWRGIRLANGETSLPVSIIGNFNMANVLDSVNFTAGETLAKYDVLYISASGTVKKANATDITKMPAVCMANAAANLNASIEVLYFGPITNASWTWAAGGFIFMDVTNGAMTQTAPSASGNIVQRVGRAITTTTILFNPSPEYMGL